MSDIYNIDLEVTKQINDTYSLSFGAQNAFDEYPDEESS